MIVVVLALGAASFFGVSAVLMHSRAHEAPAEQSMRPGLLIHLAREPLWLAGIAAQMTGFGLQATALGLGSLTVVQALSPTSLLVALVLGARMARKRLLRSDWFGVIATVGGLATLLALANPGKGHPTLTFQAWSVVLVSSGFAVGVLVIVASRRIGAARAFALGTAGGTIFAVTAALTKVVATQFGKGIAAGFGSWETYALAVLGLVGILVIQSSFQAGAIEWSLPATTAANPVVSVIIGAAAFHESIRAGGLTVVGIAVSGLVMLVGVVLLARSPAVVAIHEQTP
jgi:drug/metabolite transporter (DMT)-like permease